MTADDDTPVVVWAREDAPSCPWCGAPPVKTTSSDNRIILWRRRTDCCDKAIAYSSDPRTLKPNRWHRTRRRRGVALTPDEIEARREALQARKDRT